MHKIILIFWIFLSLSLSATEFWPDKNWIKVDLEKAGFSAAKFKIFSDYVFDPNEKHVTDGLVIIKDGRLVYENYANGYTADKKHLVWSVSKSITSALIGIAESKGLLNRKDKASKYYKELEREDARNISIHHLLQMSSGLKWNEGYEGNPLKSNVVKMLYIEKFDDMATYKATRKMKYPAGTHFAYSSGESNLLMGILKKTMPAVEYDAFPWNELFNKIGITSASWERDQAGTFVGSSYAYLTPRDLARFGLLYLRKGRWKNQKILPESWIDYTVELAPAFLQTELKGKSNAQSYGAHWWLNLDLPTKGVKRPYPDAPEDAYMAMGHHGQTLVVLPTQKIILARSAVDKKKRIDQNKMLKLLLDSLEAK